MAADEPDRPEEWRSALRPCVHCGDSHGPAMCKAEMGLKLAEAQADRAAIRIETSQEIASLKLAVADLRNQIRGLELRHYGPTTFRSSNG